MAHGIPFLTQALSRPPDMLTLEHGLARLGLEPRTSGYEPDGIPISLSCDESDTSLMRERLPLCSGVGFRPIGLVLLLRLSVSGMVGDIGLGMS